ncbi:MAG: TerC family protein, partial [Candidatus Stahlbacteria bacterium]|nr:TerC family protein [Candidatus Stahlbacteria bacterium]
MPIIWWIGFNVFVIGLLVIDLLVFNRKAHEIKMKEALLWCAVWISLALLFNLWVYYSFGHEKALEFLSAYLIEKSLSVDNLFVFLMIFTYFRVPSIYQHKVLFLGILGAIIMRTIFIFAGVALLHKFHWVIYVFGLFLIFIGIKMALQKEKQEIHPEKNPVLKLFRKIMPVTDSYEADKFIVRKMGKYFATPLLVVLVVIETTDVIFAVDSIPAVLAISRDVFIVYTSNIFAILGLRALFFVLAKIMKMFHYLNYGLSAILVFVGVKMFISHIYKINTV